MGSKWTPNKPLEAQKCYGTTSIEHPAVQMITMERGKYYMGELGGRRYIVQSSRKGTRSGFELGAVDK